MEIMRRLRVEPFELDIYQVGILDRAVRYVEVVKGYERVGGGGVTSSLLDSSGMWEEISEASGGGGILRLDMFFFFF